MNSHNNMTKFIITIFLLLFTSLIFADDILYTADGDEYKGILLGIDTDTIKFKINDEIKIYNKTDINKIKISYQDEKQANITIDNLNDTLLKNIFTQYADYDTDIYDYTILYEENEYNFANELHPFLKFRKIIKIQSEQGKEISATSILYNSLNETVVCNWGRTLHKNGNISILSQSGIEKSDIYSQLSEYNYLKELKFVLKNVNVSDIIDYSYTVDCNNLAHSNNFYSVEYFQDVVPVKEKIVKIIYPDSYIFQYSINNNNNFISETETSDKNIQTKIFNAVNVPPLKNEPLPPPAFNYIPNISFAFNYNWQDVKNYILNKVYIDTAEISELNFLKNFSSDKNIDNLKKIFNYVASEINFVNVSLNILNYEHLKLSKINKIKYASQYDKNFYLYSILKYFDYDADLLLCKQNSQGNLQEKIVSLDQFNALIIKVVLDGKIYYLNPVNENIPFGYISNNYQNIKVLNITNKNILFDYIPYSEIGQEKSDIKLELKLDAQGNLTGVADMTFFGQAGIEMREFKYQNPEEKQKTIETFVNSLFDKSVKISSYELKYLDLKESYPILLFDFDIQNFAQQIGDKFLLFKMPLVNFQSSDVAEKERYYPLYFGNRYLNLLNIKIIIPENFSINYLPPSLELKYRVHSFRNNLISEKNSINYFQEEKCNDIRADINYYEDYKKYKEKLSQYTQEWIVLKNILK